MAVVSKFEGHRSRGIVWVCDIASSSKYLNNNQSAEALETFLQRLLYMSIIFVEAAGGKFVKWTGDGFLAWFETPLLRDAGDIASSVLRAAWTLSFYVNVCQLCVKAPVKFKIRHAVTLEHDALFIDLAYSGKTAIDVLGRAIVLAFRLSSIKAEFPGVVTHRELLKLTKDTSTMRFKKIKLSKEEKLKYFKGENWGTSDIFASGGKARPYKNLKAKIKRMKKVVEMDKSDSKHMQFAAKMLTEIATGPDWCQKVQKEMNNFVGKMRKYIKEAVPILEKRATPTPH
jgi:class 3 adenylate cyclase